MSLCPCLTLTMGISEATDEDLFLHVKTAESPLPEAERPLPATSRQPPSL